MVLTGIQRTQVGILVGDVLPALAIIKGNRPSKIRPQDVFSVLNKVWIDEEVYIAVDQAYLGASYREKRRASCS